MQELKYASGRDEAQNYRPGMQMQMLEKSSAYQGNPAARVMQEVRLMITKTPSGFVISESGLRKMQRNSLLRVSQDSLSQRLLLKSMGVCLVKELGLSAEIGIEPGDPEPTKREGKTVTAVSAIASGI